MRNMKVEIDGEMKDARVFDSLWEYIDENGATVEDYELSPAENVGEKIIGDFQPSDDVFFRCGDLFDLNGFTYRHVNWGEDEYCLIPECDVNATFWTIYEWSEKRSGYVSIGQIFETEKEAREAMEERGHGVPFSR